MQIPSRSRPRRPWPPGLDTGRWHPWRWSGYSWNVPPEATGVGLPDVDPEDGVGPGGLLVGVAVPQQVLGVAGPVGRQPRDAHLAPVVLPHGQLPRAGVDKVHDGLVEKGWQKNV